MPDISVVMNGERYLVKLAELLMQDRRINSPKNMIGKIYKSRQGQIIGWEFNSELVKFSSNNSLKCSERSLIAGDRFHIVYHSYHYNPCESANELYTFRVDLHFSETSGGISLHLNTDPKLESSYPHWIDANMLPIDIKNFNAALALFLCFSYEQKKAYPAAQAACQYNSILAGIRRSL